MGHFGCVFGCVYVREVMIACPHAAHGSGQVLGPLSCQWRSVEACRERVVRLKSFTFPENRPPRPSVCSGSRRFAESPDSTHFDIVLTAIALDDVYTRPSGQGG